MLTDSDLDKRFIATTMVIEKAKTERAETQKRLFAMASGAMTAESEMSQTISAVYPLLQLQTDLLQDIYFELVAGRQRDAQKSSLSIGE